ncbi:MAG: acyl-CoA dehydrogenase [Myxococcales bacterium]|nr:MAG: acyl-CoA dehydrogenase [Myxococcales bacterium]
MKTNEPSFTVNRRKAKERLMFRIDDRDIRFNLWEYLNLDEIIKLPAYAELDRETVEILLANAFKMAKDVIAPSNMPGDREGCHYNPDGTVTTPKGYKEMYDAYVGDGWIGLTVPGEWGGVGAPQMVGMAASEAFVGANAAFGMYPGLTHGALALIMDEGTEEQKKTFLEKMITGQWGGTMCLTEAGAGSDVGANKTSAVKVREGYYKITGQKIFISSGDHDLVENNIHLVLARTPDAPKGVKGLSLFIVPKHRVKADGSLGQFNDVTCVGIEHKMGIKASSTCTLAFGEKDACEGWLIGKEGDGIKIMFHMMNEARLGVGLQGLGVAAAAYNEALDYARERVQGADAARFKDPTATAVPIINHPDVRRMLMIQRAIVHGMRALMLKTARYADLALKGSGEAQEKAKGMLELLTPICKGYGTDQAFDVTRLAIQTLGGYGYVSEYPCEQYMRDAKIFSIYEGTNGIQAMDLIGRKMGMKGGMVFMNFVTEMQEHLARLKEHAATRDFAAEFEQTLGDMQNLAMTFMGKGMEGKIVDVLLNATSFLRFMGNLSLAWLHGEMAMLAADKLAAIFKAKGAKDDAAQKALLNDSPEAAFYDGKVKTARFYHNALLPENRSLAQSMLKEDNSVMEIVL